MLSFHCVNVYFVCILYSTYFVADEERAFGFIRITTGDELSKRSKFALVTWAGSHLSALKRARLSTDKSLIKQVIQVCINEVFYL